MARDSNGPSGGSAASAGNIHVSVRWYEQTVFAGDELRCRITFANVAPKPQPLQPLPVPSQLQPAPQLPQQNQQHLKPYPPSSSSTRRQIARTPSGSHLNLNSNSTSNSSSNINSSTVSSPANLAPPPARRHHRASHSISGPVQTSGHLSKSPSASSLHGAARSASSDVNDASSASASASASTNGRPPGAGHSHRRSLSIVSISADSQVSSPGGSPQLPSGPATSQHRPARGHSRASSLQISRGSTSFFSGPRSATNPSRPFSSQPSPLFNSSFPSPHAANISGMRSGRLTGSSTMPNTPGIGSSMARSPRSPSEGFPDFKFPAAPAPADDLDPSPTATTPAEEKPLPALPNIGAAAAAPAQVPTIYEGPVAPAAEARILSTTSIAGTPRSSGEFYSLSNHSSETLASEYVAHQPPHHASSGSRSHNHMHNHSHSTNRSSLPPPPHMRQKSSQHLLTPNIHQQSLMGHGHPQQQQQHLQHQQHQQYQQQQQQQQQQQALQQVPQRNQHQALSHRARTSAAVAVVPETLMMGYAHVQGSFTLDGSLVDLNPFEQVKRKAVVGGQGGGVIGLDPMSNMSNGGGGGRGGGNSKRDSMGLLRGFGWGSLASSIGDLLGGGDLSTIKEMRDIASSKSVPLLSTPQSVLFVDLRLAPGESKTYEYTFQLPKGLPPTHRGKVMKIAYGLVIGTQRPGTAKEQRVKSIEIPFRVLGSVNSYGEILGHDLMTPYILKQDRAVIQTLSDKERSRPWTTEPAKGSAPPHHQQQEVTRRRRSSTAATISASSMNEFTHYVDELLRQQEEQVQVQQQRMSEADDSKRSGLLSPTATLSGGSRRASAASSIFWSGGGGPGRPILSLSSREAIDLAILRSNVADNYQDGSGGVSNNRFDIARNGRRVGTVMLARPAYRLGETVTMVVDFSTADADMRCYAVHAALETAERVVDNALALRSEASIQRVTRKVYASLSEATLYARRFVFTATIPASATPEFVTTGVNLEWKIKVEFVVPGEAFAIASPGVHRHGHGGHHQRISNRGHGNDDDNDSNENDDDDGDDDGGGDGDGTSNNSYNAPLSSLPPRPPPLMEESVRDERGGLILMAAETVRCESFEVAVPLRVYGWSGEVGGVSSERESHVV